MAELTKMKYRVVTTRNPKTGGTLLRPVITARNSMSLKQLVAYAKNANFVRGQQKDLEGLLGGFIEAMKDRGQAGYSINVNDWFIISGYLKGSVDETRQLTDANEYHVTITATKDLKVDIDNFSWTNVDDTTARVKVESLFSVGGDPGIITKSKEIMATGKNLLYVASYGDKVTVTYEGLDTPISLVPSESDYAHEKFAWPAALNELEDGAILTFKFTLHAGVEGSQEQVVTKVAVYRAA